MIAFLIHNGHQEALVAFLSDNLFQEGWRIKTEIPKWSVIKHGPLTEEKDLLETQEDYIPEVKHFWTSKQSKEKEEILRGFKR